MGLNDFKKRLVLSLIVLSGVASAVAAPIEPALFLRTTLNAPSENASLQMTCRQTSSRTELSCLFTKLTVRAPDKQRIETESKARISQWKDTDKIDAVTQEICDQDVGSALKGQSEAKKSADRFLHRRQALCACKDRKCRVTQLHNFLVSDGMHCRVEMTNFDVVFNKQSDSVWTYESPVSGPCGTHVSSRLTVGQNSSAAYEEHYIKSNNSPDCKGLPEKSDLQFSSLNWGRLSPDCQDLSFNFGS